MKADKPKPNQKKLCYKRGQYVKLRDLLQLDREEERDTWQVILECASTVRPSETWSGQVDVPELLTPPIAQKLAEWFLWWHRSGNAFVFGLGAIRGFSRSEIMEHGRPKLEADIEACPGIYIFVNLINRNVLEGGPIMRYATTDRPRTLAIR